MMFPMSTEEMRSLDLIAAVESQRARDIARRRRSFTPLAFAAMRASEAKPELRDRRRSGSRAFLLPLRAAPRPVLQLASGAVAGNHRIAAQLHGARRDLLGELSSAARDCRRRADTGTR